MTGFSFSAEKGRIMENIVFIELKRRGWEIYYHKQNGECDFILKKRNKVVASMQVTANLTEENKSREVKGLCEALHRYHLKEGIIITDDIAGEEKRDSYLIHYIPLWRWLLEQ